MQGGASSSSLRGLRAHEFRQLPIGGKFQPSRALDRLGATGLLGARHPIGATSSSQGRGVLMADSAILVLESPNLLEEVFVNPARLNPERRIKFDAWLGKEIDTLKAKGVSEADLEEPAFANLVILQTLENHFNEIREDRKIRRSGISDGPR
jgi:hypothetical protein